jgi:hypothetical protein
MTQFYSRNDVNYSGDVYSIPFDYIDKKEVKVYIDDELWTKWHFLSEHQLTLDEVPEDIRYSNIISVRRETNIEDKVVTYDNNSLLNKENLNKSQDQLLYAVQEIYDNNTQFAIDIRAEVDEKVERVSDAVEKLEFLEDSVEIANEAALEATEQAQIATEKAEETLNTFNEAMAEIDTLRQNSIDEVNQLVADHTDDLNALDATIKKDADAIINRVGLNMFDTVVKDHILTYEESQGLALQGAWVYKEAIAGERYGYPDFYNKCLEEYSNSNNAYEVLQNNYEVVGTPTITDDGVASGLTTNNYVTFNSVIDTNKTFNFKGSFVYKKATVSQNIFHSFATTGGQLAGGCRILLSSTGTIVLWAYTGTVDGRVVLSANNFADGDNIDFEFSFSNNKRELKVSKDGGLNWIIGQNTTLLNFTGEWQGFTVGFEGYAGSIDLPSISITVDGKEVYRAVDCITTNPNGHRFYPISSKTLIDSTYEQIGMAWMYGIDQENERIFLPRNNYFEQATGDVLEVGESISAGLPNITASATGTGGWNNASGAFTISNSGHRGTGTDSSPRTLTFNASLSSPIYGNSDTVQPNAVKKLLYICVGNTISDTSWVDVVTQVQNGTKDLDEYRKDCIKDIAAKTEEINTKLCFNMFDTVIKDHILTYEESKGLALQGTYVHKNPVAGSVHGYAGFYRKCLEEYNAATSVEEVGSTTVKVHSNGHKFYDIADKDAIDEVFNQLGAAWFYGIDTENERICLPRNINRYLVESKKPTETDSTWYNLYSDGWCEQGGIISTGVILNAITFLKPYKDTTYTAVAAAGHNTNANAGTNVSIGVRTRTGFSLEYWTYNWGTPTGYSCTWQASGYTEIPTDTKQTYTYICVGNTDIETTVTEVIDTTTTQNDTMPLFTGMYFDFTPDSLSWIKAGEQKHSGGIYKTCYNELVGVLNGSTKYGNLKVVDTAEMISGIDYSAYWKVNQAEMLFIAPDTISARTYESIAPVVGDATAIGFKQIKDGVTMYGAMCTNSGQAMFYDGCYGQPVGTWRNGSHFDGGTGIGLTTDPTKSGIEAHLVESKSGQLYFKVANAVQNLELLDAKQIMKEAVLRSSLTEAQVVIETYTNGTSWYRVWSDGWCEQGGISIIDGSGDGIVTTNFLKPFKDTNYTIIATIRAIGRTAAYNSDAYISAQTSTSFSGFMTKGSGYGRYWQACGYIK